jgi:hypothetical protein
VAEQVEQPQRDTLEWAFAWLGRYRRHSRDYDRVTDSSEAMVKTSSIHRMPRLLKKDASKESLAFEYREIPKKVTDALLEAVQDPSGLHTALLRQSPSRAGELLR